MTRSAAGARNVASARVSAAGTYRASMAASYAALMASLPSLRGWWRLGEAAGTFADSSGNANALSLSGANQTRAQVGALPLDTDGALAFNSGGSAQVADTAALKTLATISVGCWAYPTNVSASPTLVMKGVPGGSSIDYRLAVTVNGQAFWLVANTVVQNGALVGPAVPLNAWTFLVATWDGATMALYANGVLAASKAFGGTGVQQSTNAFAIGAYPDNTGALRGTVDEAFVCAAVLTPAQVMALYKLGSRRPRLRVDAPIRDSFGRADNAASMGSADTGQVWTPFSDGSCTWGISGGKAYLATRPSGAYMGTYVATPYSDVLVAADVAWDKASNHGLAFRVQDSLNWWMYRISSAGVVQIIRYANGSGSTFTGPTLSMPTGRYARYAVLAKADVLRFLLDGTEVYSLRDATYQGATRHGLATPSSGSQPYDNFAVQTAA